MPKPSHEPPLLRLLAHQVELLEPHDPPFVKFITIYLECLLAAHRARCLDGSRPLTPAEVRADTMQVLSTLYDTGPVAWRPYLTDLRDLYLKRARTT